MIEVTTVGADHVVLHDGGDHKTYDGLTPGRVHDLDGTEVQTLDHPGGELLCRFATVNDVHFGETRCGLIEGLDIGPVLSSEPGEAPYPEVMNAGAIADMAAIDPAAVVVKGDLTTNGTLNEYEAFLGAYQAAFGERLHHVRGNHDGYHGQTFADHGMARVDLPGVTLAILDTVKPRETPGQIDAEHLAWLDALAAEADRPVLVFGHHHVWDPSSHTRADDYFGIHPDDSERFIELVARRPRIRGYFAGHTHRNRTRRFAETGDVPYSEVACVKDYPGTWAEYEVYEGGIIQLHRRISSPDALAWSERCRQMFAGAYPDYAFGTVDDRCFTIPA